jgi:glycosyltransferase involved in cell wall biosynthesis
MNLPAGWWSGSVTERPLRILQVSTVDIGGGAEKVAWTLFQAYRGRGHRSSLAVGSKRSEDPDVLVIPNEASRTWWADGRRSASLRIRALDGHVPGASWAARVLGWCAEPRRSLEHALGIEDFNYPGTRRLIALPRVPPDIIHCHNLHGDYFDLRAIPSLSRQVPVILTLHDGWLLSGHCAHSFDCDRWKTGCGSCPDLTIYPAIRRDATAFNWQRKRDIYAKSRLHVATPSRWLMQKVKQSILCPGMAEAQVIPNGVDLSIFRPAERQVTRTSLGIPGGAKVLLFTANSIRRNPWKDYKTLRAAVTEVADGLAEQPLLFIALGEEAPPEQIGRAEARFVPYQNDPKAVASYYQAADIYVHAARAETFPMTVLEALACGTPVVATAVGGIPEQVKGVRSAECGVRNETDSLNIYGPDEATGVMVPPGDAHGMARAIARILTDNGLREALGKNAARDARQRFDLERLVDDYLSWYEELKRRQQCEGTAGHAGQESPRHRWGRFPGILRRGAAAEGILV